MKTTALRSKKLMKKALLFLLLCVLGMTNALAQEYSSQPSSQVSSQEATIEFDIAEISIFDERVFFLYNLLNDSRFNVIPSEEGGAFIISANDAYEALDLHETFADFREQNHNRFLELDKFEASEIAHEYKAQLPDDFVQSLMMDIYLMSRQNNTCAAAEQICTDNGLYQFPAGVNAGSGENGPYYDCLYTQPNPAWFYLEIGNPGGIDIYMYTSPSFDIDFCCWGPFTNPNAPCPYSLTSNKVVSCSYSANSSEHCIIPSTAQTGQIYILVITNYSNQSCNINFSQVSGYGSMGCSGQKTITATANPVEGGTVTGAGEYEYGSSCTLTATANEGYVFMDWTDENGTVISTDAEYTFTVRGYRTYTANFVEESNACYLTFNLNDTDGDGWSGNSLVLNFEDGTSQKLTMIDGSSATYSLPFTHGSHITLGWILGANTDQCSFTVSYANGNVICYGANLSDSFNHEFDVDCVGMPVSTYDITVEANPSAGGTVTGSGVYDYGTTCTVTAIANEGYAFAHWIQDGTIVSTDTEYSFMVLDNTTLVAQFVSAGNIVFADANVKNICVEYWDTNGDGELSYVEAASVRDLSNYFQNNTEIILFNELQYFVGLSSIGANAFNNCSELTFITLPNTLTTIGNSAFYNCSGLIGSLTIPNSVITIGNYAFYNCSGFMGLLTIGNAVTSIGNSAFEGCRNFTGSINIPNSVVTIGSSAFKGCTAFWGTLTIGNSVTTIGSEAFSGCTGLVGDIVIPNSVTSIGSSAFYNCHSFTGTLTIGDSVTSIGSSAFSQCYGLTGDLVIPNSVTSVGSSAFYSCSGFAGTLTIGNSVTTIGGSAFYSCTSLVGHIVIPNSVTTIGNEAFYNCYNFNGSLTIPSSVTSIGNRAFYYCSGISKVYYNVTNHADISEGNYYYPFQGCGGNLFIGSNVVRIPANMFRNASFTGTLTIPNSVVAINDNAFNNCWHFTGTLVIPNSINTIGISAFQDCDGLSEIIMGNNVMIVGNTAFYSCSGLTKVTLPEPVTVIGIEAFRYCTQLNEINMQSMQAPSIGWDVFANNATGRIINIPCGASANYADGYWSEWADALNEMCENYEIVVEVNPPTAGSVTGAGNYYYSEMCTLTATGNLGYPFLNWTKNNVVITTEPTYSFGVTESCTYVANFSEEPVSYDITVTANPEEGGTVTGTGSYLHGATVTLTAMANDGYSFINWTKNDVVVSASPTYDFIATEAGAYVANFALSTYEITATADPEAGGTVNGAGVYSYDATCVLTATAHEGYTFINWTKDNEEVSANPTYSFNVIESGAYVAHFELNSYEITASANPEAGGTVEGVGTYDHFSICTLTATATAGYTFANWTENGVVISTNASYSFTVTRSRNLVANFVLDYHWNVDIHQYPNNMAITGIVQIDGVEQTNPALEIGAFCNGECRGAQRLTYYSQADRYLVFLLIYGEEGDLVNFKLYNHETGEEKSNCYSLVTFIANNILGSSFNPYAIDFNNMQPTQFSEGWNWWSTYIEQDGIDGLSLLENSLGTNGITIKSQSDGYVDYYDDYGIWYGSLNSIDNESFYMVKTSTSCTINLAGNTALPSQHPITVDANGWTWIGYPVAYSMDINAALGNLSSIDGDMLKSQEGYAEFYEDYGWFGSLGTLSPSMGYMYKSNNDSPVTFTYPDNGRTAMRDNITAKDNHWVPVASAYPFNMTVTAIVELDGEELRSDRYELAAFANGESRGSVRLMYVEPIDRYVAFLTIAGEEATELSLSLYDMETGMEYFPAEENIVFEADATLGRLAEPFVVSFRGTTGVDELANSLRVYPNPVKAGERFSIGMNAESKAPVRVEIVNALGAVVSVETSTQAPASIKAPEAAGIYTLKISCEKGTCYSKLIVR